MKKKNLICLGLIVLCLLLLWGYRQLDRLRTDVTPPVISFPEETQVFSVKDGRELLLQGVTATDDTDGDVTGSLLVEKITLLDRDGLASVSYAAFDAAGNVTKATREIQYSDSRSPRFQLSAPLLFAQSYIYNTLDIVTATDVIDGDLQHKVRATSLSDSASSEVGVHDVEFKVTNSLGDTVKLILPVEVYAAGSYNGQLRLTDYLIYLEPGEKFRAEDYLDCFVTSYTTVSLRGGVPSSYTLDVSGQVDPSTPGIYCINYTIRNNSTHSGYTRLIVVVEG
ncbi:MAG: hypothetical protein IJ357_06515 [Oscillospiraceae bacterium]|nr:hypothetical protein [Oscillospiraceae bacterium]